MERDTLHCQEENSKIIFSARKVSDEGLAAFVGGRKFVSLEQLDSTGKDQAFEQKTGLFTVAVIVEKSTMRTSQNGKGYMFFIVSDLERLDTLRLQKEMEAIFKGDRDQIKGAMKSYSNGYKISKFMAFGDAAKKTLDLKAGTIVAFINPKKLDPNKASLGEKQKGPTTFCIDNENQVLPLGLSRFYDVCAG